ncbi:MAG: cytochrome c biogenesis protein CcsA [Candidatus Synoicihabitans palmerolidicus]|nr:cytochrome c biogenesis protein CcsA [Candidatus Synoicihabitans palmerolidicus]
MKRFFPYLVLVLGVAFLAFGLLPAKNKTEFDLHGFARLPVLADGRIKPMDTIARTSLLTIQGRQRFTTKTPSAISLTPTEWLLDVLYRPELADTYRHFKIDHPGVLDVLGLTPENGDGKNRFSYDQIASRLEELDRQATMAESVETQLRDAFQRAIQETHNRVIRYQQLKHALVMPDGRDFLSQLQVLQDELPDGIAAVRARSSGEPHDEKLAERMIDAGQVFLRLDQIGTLLPLPPMGEDTSDLKWKKTGRALLESFQTGIVNPYALTYAALGRAWREQHPTTFNTLIGLYVDQLENRFSDRLQKVATETAFNRAKPFYHSSELYVVTFLLAITSWLIWARPLQQASSWLLALAWITTTASIITRMWLEGRPPVTNLYSSALFVGWGAAGLCLILERLYRNGIGSTAGGLIGFATLLIAHHLSLQGDTLEMMRAVLDSNFWLATHVIIITLGYSATYLAGFLALIYVGRGVLTKSLDRPTADALNRMVYGIVCFATLFSLVGTILGGIWADQSWGRFWGWDPKENGALIIVMWNAVILHARWGSIARTRGIMALAIFGNIVTSWSWFGTNMLGVGLHSYGFMDAAFWSLLIFVISQLILIAVAYIPPEKWLSASSLARTETPRSAHSDQDRNGRRKFIPGA